jgi:hypothetical protein
MTTPTHIRLTVEGEFPCTGELEVTQLAPNRFRLEEGPFLMFEGGLHDIIEADLQDDGSYVFRGVIETSTWQKFDFVLSEELAESDPFKERLFTTVEHLGGTWETIFGGLVSLYLPQGIPFDLQKHIDAITEELRSNPEKIDTSGISFLGKQRSLTYDLSQGDKPPRRSGDVEDV